jgi:hypothetical protein
MISRMRAGFVPLCLLLFAGGCGDDGFGIDATTGSDGSDGSADAVMSDGSLPADATSGDAADGGSSDIDAGSPDIDAGSFDASADAPLWDIDGSLPDGGCLPGDSDGDGASDCDEIADGSDYTSPFAFNGLTAAIGHIAESTGSCDALDDFAEMSARFEPPVQAQDVYAGWEFDTDADSYGDPSYGFQPAWPSADNAPFGVRYRGRMRLTHDTHCFSIDIGATGTDIINGRNACGQIYIGLAAPPVAPLAETEATPWELAEYLKR